MMCLPGATCFIRNKQFWKEVVGWGGERGGEGEEEEWGGAADVHFGGPIHIDADRF